MIRVSILVLKHAVLSSISDSAAVFRKVNELLAESGKEPCFDVQLVGLTSEVLLEKGLVTLRPDAIADDVTHTDLIIVPSFSGYVNNSMFVSKECAPWIARHYKNGSEVASLCTGAFMVAYSGILNGKECTTHWAYSNEFRYFFPGVKLVDEKIVTDQDGLYSSGGSNSYWNLLIYLVEKFTNRETAIRAAKYFVIDLDKTNQSAFIIFQGLKDHDDEPVLKAQQYIEQHYWEKFTVDQLAGQFNMTRRTFERRFKKATRNTVAEYIQRMKVEATKKQLEIGRKSINELMVDVGYSDIQAFREVFKRITGMTPIDYRKKYRS
ncbi:MAG: helix-turn-helix domain-containing protein [Bacteroidota bacterium]